MDGLRQGTRVLTVKDAAARLRISERFVRLLMARGELEAVCIGRRRLVSEEALERFVRDHTRVVGGANGATGQSERSEDSRPSGATRAPSG